MSEGARINLTILWEEEVRLASKALHIAYKLAGDATVSREDSKAATARAIEACAVALWHANEDRPIVLSSAASLTATLRRRVMRKASHRDELTNEPEPELVPEPKL